MNRKRYLVRANGADVEATRVGVSKCVELLGTDKNGVIVVPNLQNLQHTMLVGVLGEDLAKTLIKERTITFRDGNRLDLCSEQTLKNFTRADVYLALWGSPAMVGKIEEIVSWRDLVFVTWLSSDADAWLDEHKDVHVVYGGRTS